MAHAKRSSLQERSEEAQEEAQKEEVIKGLTPSHKYGHNGVKPEMAPHRNFK